MIKQVPGDHRRLRARKITHAGASSFPGFRIEDASGKVLGTIRGARHGQEALALYWRRVGSALPGIPMSDDLDRRLRARRRSDDEVTRTPQLPFAAGLSNGAGSRQRPASSPRRDRMQATSDTAPQSDLFEGPAAESTEVALVAEASIPVGPEPWLLKPDLVMLQTVDPGTLHPADRADAYLYHVTTGPDAELALRQGLGVSASDPVMLTERQGVAYWISALAENDGDITDGPAQFAVLRLRRLAVQDLLEHDVDASLNAGCRCFLLTGGTGSPG